MMMHMNGQRMLGLFMVVGSALLAMVLTNDIALFVVVPLTLGFGELTELPTCRLIIFETLAVNAGSMLSPIGNPQNIYLWQLSGGNFGHFAVGMLPPFAITSLVLLPLAWWAFPDRRFALTHIPKLTVVRRPLLWTSVLLYIPFLVLMDLHYTVAGLILILAAFVIGFPRLLRLIDWPLLAVIILMFVDLGLLAQYPLPGLQHLAHRSGLFVSGALISQVLSNVPTAILLTKYSHDWQIIAWAADIGGFGLVIGSLANIIALRIGRQPGSFAAFHLWSVPFFIVVATLTWLWIRFL